MWAETPWHNDQSADWFSKLMNDTSLPARIRYTLLRGSTAQLKAAAWCILQFGRVSIWPADQLQNDLKLAIKALNKVLEDEKDAADISQIKAAQQELQNRLTT